MNSNILEFIIELLSLLMKLPDLKLNDIILKRVQHYTF